MHLPATTRQRLPSGRAMTRHDGPRSSGISIIHSYLVNKLE